MTPYLAPPPAASAHTYGRLRLSKGWYFLEDAAPELREMAKRVFPGCVDRGRHDRLRFRANRRAVGELNWLMLRFPLLIEDRAAYDAWLDQAAEHAIRRDANQHLPPAEPPATFAGQLTPFQAEGVSYLIANQRALLADEMGLGKTVQALAALATAEAFPALVVVPPPVRRQWQRQAGAFLRLPVAAPLLPGVAVEHSDGSDICELLDGLTPYALANRPLTIIHYGLLRAWYQTLLEIPFRAVIFDEVQELRHTGTKKYSAASLLAGSVDLVWGLSGTPIHNYGSEIWSITNILDFNCLGNFDSFSREWCTGYGTKVVEKPDLLNAHLLREGLMIRRRKRDVQSQLPPKRRVVHCIDHDEDQYRMMIAEATALANRYHEIQGWHDRGKAALEIESSSRKATGVSKAPYVAAFVTTLLEAGERPLVYGWHHDVHDTVGEQLAKTHRVGRVTGRETQKQKDDAVTAFGRGELDVMLLSLRATAGLDGLQGTATCVVFAELDWSPAVHSQCEDRLHRMGIGELDSVLCYYLVSQTGHDGVMMDALGLKVGQFCGVMGDPAETAEDRVLAQRDGTEHIARVIERLKSRSAA
jgi:SNF2 family DNA or RNA helicase